VEEVLDDEEKTMMFVRGCGWRVNIDGYVFDEKDLELYNPWHLEPYDDEQKNIVLDLYDKSNMALAWRVLNWATAHNDADDNVFNVFSQFNNWWGLFQIPAEDAVRLFLDEILILAIESGRVKIPSV
jgi:hypothetical protein